MICKNCGHETSYVICDNCGVNVVWFNKYGRLGNEVGELDLLSNLTDKEEKDKIEEVIEEIFVPDGSGD